MCTIRIRNKEDFPDFSTVIQDACRHVIGTSRRVVSTPRLAVGAPRLVVSAPRLVVGVPRFVVGTHWLGVSSPRCSRTCCWCSQVLPWLSPDQQWPYRFITRASRWTRRPPHWSSKLWDLTTLRFCSNNFQALSEAPRDETHYADAVVSLTMKPKQHNPKHPRNHQLMMGDKNTDTCRPTILLLGLAKVQACGLLHVQMLNILKAMSLSDDCESNVKQAPELKNNRMA